MSRTAAHDPSRPMQAQPAGHSSAHAQPPVGVRFVTALDATGATALTVAEMLRDHDQKLDSLLELAQANSRRDGPDTWMPTPLRRSGST